MTAVGMVSAHLALAEVACTNRLAVAWQGVPPGGVIAPYPEEWADRLRLLAVEFERIRAAIGGKKLRVNSAFRTRDYNASIGGAPYSQHCEGRALDLAAPLGMSARMMALRIKGLLSLYPDCQIRGIGRYSTFVHIDIRPASTLVEWDG